MKQNVKKKDVQGTKTKYVLKITEIKETDFCLHEISEDEIKLFDSSKIELSFGVNLGYSNEKKIVTFGFRTIYNYPYQNRNQELLKVEFFINFSLQSSVSVIKSGKGGEVDVNDDFFIHLLSIAIGTARGIIYTKTTGHFISKFCLPLVDPKKLFKSLMNNKVSEQ